MFLSFASLCVKRLTQWIVNEETFLLLCTSATSVFYITFPPPPSSRIFDRKQNPLLPGPFSKFFLFLSVSKDRELSSPPFLFPPPKQASNPHLLFPIFVSPWRKRARIILSPANPLILLPFSFFLFLSRCWQFQLKRLFSPYFLWSQFFCPGTLVALLLFTLFSFSFPLEDKSVSPFHSRLSVS